VRDGVGGTRGAEEFAGRGEDDARRRGRRKMTSVDDVTRRGGGDMEDEDIPGAENYIAGNYVAGNYVAGNYVTETYGEDVAQG